MRAVLTNEINNKWKSITGIVDALQHKSEEDGVNVEQLAKYFAEVFPKDFLIAGGLLSIVYWAYNTADYKVFVEGGVVKDDLDLTSSSLLGDAGAIESIKHVIHGKPPKLANSKKECLDFGFKNCGGVIVVPMRIEKNRSIGAFVFQVESEGILDESVFHILDAISDRLAIFIRYLNYKQRAEIIQRFFNASVEKIGKIEREEEILDISVNHLKEWFSKDEINIVLFHPFDRNKVYLACEKGVVKKDFPFVAGEQLSNLALFGASPEDLLSGQEVIVLNTEAEIQEKQLPQEYRSYIFAPMRTRKGKKIGFFVLRNRHQDYAYKDEVILLSRFADSTALNLRNYRRDKSNQELKYFRVNYINNENFHSDKDLYEGAVKAIESIYGWIGLTVIYLKKGSDIPEVEYQRRAGVTLTNVNSSISQNEVTQKFQDEIKKKIKTNEPSLVPKDGFGTLFSIHADNGLLVRLFIVESNRSLPGNFKIFTEELLSLIGFKQALNRKSERLQALSEFESEIAKNDNFYKLTYDYIEKVMTVSNMYVALLDRSKGEISFPCFYQKKSDASDVEEIKVEARLFDKNSEKKGRTEEILVTGRHILISTKEESVRWYAAPGHEEKIGDPYASWVGVPITNLGENIGIIALYHPSKDFLYDKLDVAFLQNVASRISDLFTYQKLIKIQKEIADREALLASTLFAQDITHRLNNMLGSLSINLRQTKEDVEQVLKSGNIEPLKNTRDIFLFNSVEVVDNLLSDVSRVFNVEPQKISIKDILKQLVNQIKIEKKLDEVSLIFKFPPAEIMVSVLFRNLVNCLYTIIENAAAALLEKQDSPFDVDELYMEVTIHEKNQMVFVDIADNGTPISTEIKNSIFDLGVSAKLGNHGYGLWRARQLAASLGGELELFESNPRMKAFRLSLPVVDQKPLAFVVEDERVWRDIISGWLNKAGFEVEMADSVNAAKSLFNNSKRQPQVVFLDIALDLPGPSKLDAINVDGLGLISEAKKLNSEVVIVVLTGYKERASKYKKDYTFLLEKVKNGKPLAKEEFFKFLKNLNFSK